MEELFYDWGVLADDMMVEDIGPDFRAQGGDLIIRRFAEHPILSYLSITRSLLFRSTPHAHRSSLSKTHA